MKLTLDLPVLNGQPAKVDLRKPAKGEHRTERKRRIDRRGKAFRDAVWREARARSEDGEAYCDDCGIGPLQRGGDPLHPKAGHVAHDRGRNVAPEDKFNPLNARVKCRDCHLGKDHHMRFAR